jgi:hypothetical protein
MVEGHCSLCGGEINAPPNAGSDVRYLRGEEACLIIADSEYPVHKCPRLTREEATELLQLHDMELPEDWEF